MFMNFDRAGLIGGNITYSCAANVPPQAANPSLTNLVQLLSGLSMNVLAYLLGIP